MILHLVTDEKVINRTIEVFEETLPGQNTFICILNFPEAKLVKKHKSLIFYYKNEECLPDFSLYDRVIIHLMTYNSIDFCNKYIPISVPISWVIWGGDISNQLLAFFGASYYYSKRFLTYKFRFQMFISRLGIRWPRLNMRTKFLEERVQEYITEFDSLFDLKKIIKVRPDAIQREFFYYPIHRVLGEDLIGKYVSGSNILVNHSASITGNHDYVFKHLKSLDLKGRRIITPLSYNGTKVYAEYIKNLGYKYFAECYIPLFDFLPLDEYNRLMLSSEICIYGHWRGEAWGNILVALYLGAKVYLSEKSELIPLLNRLNVKYFILEKIDANNFFMPLSAEDKLLNRDIIENRYSEERLKDLIKENWG